MDLADCCKLPSRISAGYPKNPRQVAPSSEAQRSLWVQYLANRYFLPYAHAMGIGGHRKQCQRWNTPWDAHALTFSCYRRMPLLLSERTRRYLADAVTKARTKHIFDVWAYVLMPEHVHLVIWPTRETYSISDILKSIKQSAARRALNWLRRENPSGLVPLATGHKDSPHRFWQDGGGYDRNIRDSAALRAVIDYIHGNPVKRGLVSVPDDWKWSSYRAWMLDEDGPISLDRDSCRRSLV